jgi:UDP-N-acetylglucosamine 2-epimerase
MVTAAQMDCSGTVNPYGDGRATERVLAALRKFMPFEHLDMKRFFDA